MADPARILPTPEPSSAPRRDPASNSSGMISPIGEARRPPLGWCPSAECAGLMHCEPPSFDDRMGVDALRCDRCGTQGLQSHEGVILLFRGGYEYKFSFGPSVETLTVVLSSAAVNLWSTHGVSPDHLAIYAAEWALLKGIRNRPVRLMIESEDFVEFYRYFTKH
ncbi:MAG: hypothetical protein U0361_03755 [Nitrospiraceae bacterium]